MNIGILDFGIRERTVSSIENLENLTEALRAADSFGFERYWLSEHHSSSPISMWSNPEVLIPLLTGMTEQMKIGVGGIQLNLHSPYRIAYTFKLLSNLFPERIELGLAKGYNKGVYTIQAVKSFFQTDGNQSFEDKVQELFDFYNKEDFYYENGIVLPPYKGLVPDVFYLKGREANFEEIVHNKGHLVRTIFHHGSDPEINKEKIDEFKENYIAVNKTQPIICLSFSGACNISRKKALQSFEGFDFGFIEDNLVGEAQFIVERLKYYTDRYGIENFLFMDVALSHSDRLKGMEQLAKYI